MFLIWFSTITALLAIIFLINMIGLWFSQRHQVSATNDLIILGLREDLDWKRGWDFDVSYWTCETSRWNQRLLDLNFYVTCLRPLISQRCGWQPKQPIEHHLLKNWLGRKPNSTSRASKNQTCQLAKDFCFWLCQEKY